MDDKINQAVERLSEIIFNNYMSGNTKKDPFGDIAININTNILRECGFDVDYPSGVFFNLVCPRLKREKILWSFSDVSHPYGDLSGKYTYVSFSINPERLMEKYEKLNNLGKNTRKEELPKIFIITKNGSKIWVNKKYLMNNPHYNAKNELFFDYAFNNPNKKITKSELEKSIKEKFGKEFSSTITELGFTSEIRHAFFPKANGKSAFYFRNPLIEEQIKKDKIDVELLVQELKTQNLRKNKNKMSDSV